MSRSPGGRGENPGSGDPMNSDRSLIARAEALLKSRFVALLAERHEEMLAHLAGHLLGVFRTERPVVPDLEVGTDSFASHGFRADDFSTVAEFLDEPRILSKDRRTYSPLQQTTYDDQAADPIRDLVLACALDAAHQLDEEHPDEANALRADLKADGAWTPQDVCIPLDREEVDAELALRESLRARSFGWFLTTGSRRIAETKA